jgi:hypothetical protein
MSDYRKTKAWREANPEKYRKWRKTYMREYMARRRGKKPAPNGFTVTAVDKKAKSMTVEPATGPAPAEPEPAHTPAPDVSVVEEVAGTAALQECVDRADPVRETAAETMTRARWKKMGPDTRQDWLRKHKPEITEEDALNEWLEGLPR